MPIRTPIRRRPAWRLTLAILLITSPATAQERAPSGAGRPELVAGVFDHGTNFHPLGSRLFFPDPPPGGVVQGQEENGTADVQLGYRSGPVRWLLHPRLVAKAQVSTAGRTSFASIGAEWRQHVFGGRLYGQAGIGLTVHDGYRFTPDPSAPGVSDAEVRRRRAVRRERTAFGSRVLFNPNASIGVRLNDRWAAELAWEHFSHLRLFSNQNPGIDHLGLRLVRKLGR